MFCGGINAGVMLLQPNQHVFNEMVAELSEPNHPEHCNGNGPEQETSGWREVKTRQRGSHISYSSFSILFPSFFGDSKTSFWWGTHSLVVLQAPWKVNEIRCSQDYLSRYFADSPWKHIGVEYNFQIHHFFNCLHPDKACWGW